MTEMTALRTPRYICSAIALWAVTSIAGAPPSATSVQAEVMTMGANADLSKGDLLPLAVDQLIGKRAQIGAIPRNAVNVGCWK